MSAPLIHLDSRAVHLPDTNIDTDIIFPARFLLRTDREGLGDCAFADRRFLPDGAENPEFPLNRDGWRGAQVIVGGAGFGCGSSREHAVWALVDIGIRLVIAPDFGEIFAGNAVKNGLLVLRLPPETCAGLGQQAEAGETFTLDMRAQTLHVGGRLVCGLDLAREAQEAFLNGWDELDVILNRDMDSIRDFEAGHRARQPWLFAAS
ncbi:3-isopropylmalate dehydratase small subunit [Salipiger marinus]|uniref:3-isopropylmalate dehydratase small subunit n=1 Tax=Salipiger marinus TaxID=555512 RepID=UPI0040589BEA